MPNAQCPVSSAQYKKTTYCVLGMVGGIGACTRAASPRSQALCYAGLGALDLGAEALDLALKALLRLLQFLVLGQQRPHLARQLHLLRLQHPLLFVPVPPREYSKVQKMSKVRTIPS